MIFSLFLIFLSLPQFPAQTFDESAQLENGDEIVRSSMQEALRKVNRAIIKTKKRWECDDVWDHSMQLFQFFKRPPSEQSARMARAGDLFEVSLDLIRDKYAEKHPRMKRRANVTDVLTPATLKALAGFSGCLSERRIPVCETGCIANKYRTITGECNNLRHVYWGASNNEFARWESPVYENDFSTPLGWNEDRRYNGFALPLVRHVSNEIISTTNDDVTDDAELSHMAVVWGQYIDHDIDFTPQSLSTSTFQGLTDCAQTCRNEPPCFPIQLPEGDSKRSEETRCLPFFRSAAVCGSGDTSSLFDVIKSREQINAVTSFVDASTVYGSSEMLQTNLRDVTNEDGLLRVNEQYTDGTRAYLPFNPNNPCVQDPRETGSPIPCFLAGDGRVSEHLTLSAIHTLWLREHNRLARDLKVMNPHWSGNTIYEEARKIVGAYHQIVNYKEYVPKIVGPAGLSQMGDYAGYDPDADPTVSNVFATAAFRFGHTTIAPFFRRLDENYEEDATFGNILLHDAFFSPWRIVRQGGLDLPLRGLIGKPAKLIKSYQIMHEELREKLFQLQNKVALDLASLNLQRGRDHALPLYNEWRVHCGYSRVQNFSQLSGMIANRTVRDKLEAVYGHPGNMDVWLAGLVEDLEPGSRLGPTFRCLIAKQFQLLRDGDRFFYGNPGVFTSQQLTSLETLRMSRLVCDNSGVRTLPEDVFSVTGGLVACSDLPDFDLAPWREETTVGSCGTPPSVENGGWRLCEGRVFYDCFGGYVIMGNNGIECNADGSFDAAPTCMDMNECDVNNGSCAETCTNTRGSYECGCFEGNTLNSDGVTCSMDPTAGPSRAPVQGDVTTSIVLGVVLGVLLLVALLGLGYLFHTNKKLSKENKYKSESRYNLDNKAYVNDPSS